MNPKSSKKKDEEKKDKESSPKLLKTLKEIAELFILAAKAYEAYETAKPLIDAACNGFGLYFMSVRQTSESEEPTIEFERQGIALGTLAQVLRELRTATLPAAEYDSEEMYDSVSRAVQHMIEAEKYVSILPTIETVAFKQKLESALPIDKSAIPKRPKKP